MKKQNCQFCYYLPPPIALKKKHTAVQGQLVLQVSLDCGCKGSGETQVKEQVWSDGIYKRICFTVVGLKTVTGRNNQSNHRH